MTSPCVNLLAATFSCRTRAEARPHILTLSQCPCHFVYRAYLSADQASLDSIYNILLGTYYDACQNAGETLRSESQKVRSYQDLDDIEDSASERRQSATTLRITKRCVSRGEICQSTKSCVKRGHEQVLRVSKERVLRIGESGWIEARGLQELDSGIKRS